MDYTVVGTRFYEGYLYGSVSQLQPCWCLGRGHSWLHGWPRHCRMFSSLSPSTRASPWLRGKESPCQWRRHRFSPWVGKIPWRRKWQPTQVFLPGNPMDRGAWWATVHGVAKSQTWAHIPYPTASTYQPPVAPQWRQPKNVSINCQISQWSKITIPLALKVTAAHRHVMGKCSY